jgi:hypothetical protein
LVVLTLNPQVANVVAAGRFDGKHDLRRNHEHQNVHRTPRASRSPREQRSRRRPPSNAHAECKCTRRMLEPRRRRGSSSPAAGPAHSLAVPEARSPTHCAQRAAGCPTARPWRCGVSERHVHLAVRGVGFVVVRHVEPQHV